MLDHADVIQLAANNKKVLVTGGSGLVGSELIRQLSDAGYDLTALYNNHPIDNRREGLKTIQCDILDANALQEAMTGIDVVFHCAALVSFDPADSYKLLKVNVEGTTNVVNACIEAGVKKIVHVSSVAAMGRIRENEVVNESMQWSEKTSNSIYGKSKYLAELEIWRGVGEGLEAVIVNPSIILGGDSWEDGSTALFKSAYNEFPWYTEGVSGFVSVKDVAKAMIALMNTDIINERFILNGSNVSYKNIFSMMAASFKKKSPYKKVTPLLSAIIWRVEGMKGLVSGKKPLLTKETAATAQAKVSFDNSKLLKYLPDFSYSPIENIIAETCERLMVKYKL